MNKPRNHHFVSQVHIKNFFNNTQGKIFIYDKILDNFYFKTTTKSLFSEKDLNTRLDNGLKDFESLENDLNYYFEKDFPVHYLTIKNFIEELNYSKEVKNALLFFAKYGAIGGIRNPREKQSNEMFIYEVFSKLAKNATPQLKRAFDEAFSYKNEIKHINSTQYSIYANEVIDLMGDLIFRIEIPREKDDYFILPDSYAGTIREKINEYFNPDVEEIAYISFPLSSKIYIHFYSSKIKNITIKSAVGKIDSDIVFERNKVNLNYCISKVACESEYYLKKIIKTLYST